MPASTVPVAGTRKAIRTSTDFGSGLDYGPSRRWCNRCTIQWISGGELYLGLQKPIGVADTVSSTVNDIVLNSSNPSFTIGPSSGEGGNDVDLGGTYLDASVSGTAYRYAPVSV